MNILFIYLFSYLQSVSHGHTYNALVPAIFPILEGLLERTFWYRLQFVQRILLNFFNAVKTATISGNLSLGNRKKSVGDNGQVNMMVAGSY